MLQFYYDFLGKYIDRRDYELIQMDTYFALSYDTLEEAVKPELLKEFENNKKQWLSWYKWTNREPGLFNLEKEGRGPSPYAASATLLMTRKAPRQRCLPRACHKSRICHPLNQISASSLNKSTTSRFGKGTRRPWRGSRTWPQTEASGCRTRRRTHTINTSVV